MMGPLNQDGVENKIAPGQYGIRSGWVNCSPMFLFLLFVICGFGIVAMRRFLVRLCGAFASVRKSGFQGLDDQLCTSKVVCGNMGMGFLGAKGLCIVAEMFSMVCFWFMNLCFRRRGLTIL
jgi:hypothetical protein